MLRKSMWYKLLPTQMHPYGFSSVQRWFVITGFVFSLRSCCQMAITIFQIHRYKRGGDVAFQLFNVGKARLREESAWSPCPLAAERRGALFQWALRKSQLTWRGHPAGPAPAGPSSSQHDPRGGAIARGGWWSGAECDEGKAREVSPLSNLPHRSPPPAPKPTARPRRHPRRPHPTQLFQAFSLCPPGEPQIINRRPHRTGTAPHPTHRSAPPALEPPVRPSPASRTPLFRDLPCRVPCCAGRGPDRGRPCSASAARGPVGPSGSGGCHANRAGRIQIPDAPRCPLPVGTHRHYSSLARRCLFSVLVQAMIDHQRYEWLRLHGERGQSPRLFMSTQTLAVPR